MSGSTDKVQAQPDLRYEPISFTEIKLLSGYKITLTLAIGLTNGKPVVIRAL